MKRKYLPLLLCLCFAVSGCGKADLDILSDSPEQEVSTQEASTETSEVEADSAEAEAPKDETLVPIDEWEEKWAAENGSDDLSTEEFDASQYDGKVVGEKVDEVVNNSSSIEEEMKGIEKVAYYYTNFHNADLGQQDMNVLSDFESDTWDYEIQSLLKRILDEADASKKDSIKADQAAWEENYQKCQGSFSWEGGSAAPMMNAGMNARFLKNRAYMLAKELADIKGEKYELPKRFFRENSYMGEDGALDITAGMEGGSLTITYAPKGKDAVEMLTYDPMINENTISFRTSFMSDEGEEVLTNEGDAPIVGTITYGWDGATLTITESGDKNLPAGTEVKFSTAM
ncbi:MAG: DUF1311 domain-containing protein [Butyrivibrio sp.]|nr:DUF1311 domain-containing protein [Butyrivibrio sp.]